MTAPLQVFLAGVAGFAAALIYFAGLRLTVEALGSVHRPGWLLIGSLALRLGLLLSVLWLVAGWTGAAGLVAALVGVIAARSLVVHRVLRGLAQPPPAEGARPDTPAQPQERRP
jgi:F1F0 ATPase subunit 2